MRTIRFLLEKEFRQIFRNRAILAMILVVPVVQLLLLPLAANYEVKHINLALVDHDHSPVAQRMIDQIMASRYFRLAGYTPGFNQAYQLLEEDKADIVLEIPVSFEAGLVRGENQRLLVAVNAINGSKAGLGAAYLHTIIRNFNSGLIVEQRQVSAGEGRQQVEVITSNWYNPLMNYNLFMVPGILAILVTMIGGYLTALNIVREKETGTIEQINVTPIRKYQFILGKLIPFWVLGIVVFTLGMGAARLVYGIIPAGSILVLYGFVVIYLLAVLGLGLLISTYCETQQQAMFIAFFFLMIFIMMSGLFTPVDSMPQWAKIIAAVNPVSYMVEVMRMVILKGSGWKDIMRQFLTITGFALILNTWAILNYRKRS